jgi:hypothetical protein
VKGHEAKVLEMLCIPWQNGAPHINCPYPDHLDANPSWRWHERRARAYCTCIDHAHSIFEVLMHVERLEFAAAKLRVAEILGRTDLTRDSDRHRTSDASSLLQPPADEREDVLPRSYLAYRLGVPAEEVFLPSTSVVGWRQLPYYDPPATKGGRGKLVGQYPCIVFATLAPDGRQHAHRIYVAPGGAGKAELGVSPDGHPRDPKKSAKLRYGQSAVGCAVLWGDPVSAPHLLLAEGIETAAALADAHQEEIEADEIAIAAALSTSGIRAFVPWPSTRVVTVAADRDEGKPGHDRGFKAGEKAARSFARAHHDHVEIRIALPGHPGEDVDWLEVLQSAGPAAVRVGIAGAQRFGWSADTDGAPPDADAFAVAGHDDGEVTLGELVDRAKADPSTPFEPEALSTLVAVRQDNPLAYQRTIRQLKQAGVRLRDLERELRRASFRVIEGGPETSSTDAAVAAGPYFVTSAGMIAWRKETRDGWVPIPLCNFTAQIVVEQVIDDGAERRTILAIEGVMPDGRRLPCARVPAERFTTMSWVTEAWGTAPVIFAGQGRKDHLRAAIQMLSGSVARHTVYGHLGWRRIDERWVFLHSGGAIGAEGMLEGIEVDTGTDSFLATSSWPRPRPTSSRMRSAPRLVCSSSGPPPSPRRSSAPCTARRWPSRPRSTSPFTSPGRPARSRPSSRRWRRRTSAPGSAAGVCRRPGPIPPTCSRRRRSSAKTPCWWSTTSPRPARPGTSSGCTARPIVCSVPRGTARAGRECAPTVAAGRRTTHVG